MPFQSSSNSKPRSGRVGTSSNQPPIHLKSADHQPFQLQLINALQYVSHQRLNSWRRADWQISSNPAQLEAIFCRQLRFWVTRCFGETFANIIINIMEARVVGQSKVDSAWKIRARSYVSCYPTPPVPHSLSICFNLCVSSSKWSTSLSLLKCFRLFATPDFFWFHTMETVTKYFSRDYIRESAVKGYS